MKIFGIGLNKTGTKTLGYCLTQLGCKHKTFDFDLLKKVRYGDFQSLLKAVNLYDSFEDWPYPLYFKELDTHFRGSKFILTTRSSPAKWLDSLESHSLRTDPERAILCRSLCYGYPYPHCNREYFLNYYTNHIQTVRNYFQDRPQDLLEICWEAGDGYSKLCQFLGKKSLSLNVPHLNKRATKSNLHMQQNTNILQSLGFI